MRHAILIFFVVLMGIHAYLGADKSSVQKRVFPVPIKTNQVLGQLVYEFKPEDFKTNTIQNVKSWLVLETNYYHSIILCLNNITVTNHSAYVEAVLYVDLGGEKIKAGLWTAGLWPVSGPTE